MISQLHHTHHLGRFIAADGGDGSGGTFSAQSANNKLHFLRQHS